MSDFQGSIDRISPGGFSLTIFIGSTVYLGLVNHGWQTLLTYKAALFLLVGLFLTVTLIGVPFHLVRIWLQKKLFKTDATTLSPAKINQIKATVTILMVLQVVVSFYATKFAYLLYFS
jgi:uncharacterized membrane protein